MRKHTKRMLENWDSKNLIWLCEHKLLLIGASILALFIPLIFGFNALTIGLFLIPIGLFVSSILATPDLPELYLLVNQAREAQAKVEEEVEKARIEKIKQMQIERDAKRSSGLLELTQIDQQLSTLKNEVFDIVQSGEQPVENKTNDEITLLLNKMGDWRLLLDKYHNVAYDVYFDEAESLAGKGDSDDLDKYDQLTGDKTVDYVLINELSNSILGSSAVASSISLKEKALHGYHKFQESKDSRHKKLNKLMEKMKDLNDDRKMELQKRMELLQQTQESLEIQKAQSIAEDSERNARSKYIKDTAAAMRYAKGETGAGLTTQILGPAAASVLFDNKKK